MDHQLEMLSEGNKFITAVMGEKAPKLVVVPKGEYITIPQQCLEGKLEDLLSHIAQCTMGTDLVRESLVSFYVDKRKLEDEIVRRADLSMKLVSDWRGE